MENNNIELKNKRKQLIKDIITYAVIIITVILIRVFIFDPVRVDGPSMNTTLKNGEIVILNKIKYRKEEIKRNDVVVIKFNEKICDSNKNCKKKSKRIIKRVIGLPNETVSIKNNKIYINGEEIENNYASTETADFDLSEIGLEKIPGDSYFVLGDNRTVSYDSRYTQVGTIKKDQIEGQAVLIIWPLNKISIIK